ncbi:MAG: PmoA family protein [Phycisphaeraceae bacterium]|nr:PmoA family protein [Phycisphaeraceae bacterium]
MKIARQCHLTAIVTGVILSTTFLGLCMAEEPVMQVTRDLYTGQIVITEGDVPVLKYNYQLVCPPKGLVASVAQGNRKYARARSNYIHPLYGPSGEELTYDWSRDHPHHRGIYWAWPEVDWHGERGDLHALQRVYARPTGNVSFETTGTFGKIVAENRWFWEDETPIVREVTTICAHQANDQGRFIDLTYSFEALEDDVALARRGTNAYGGLNIRMSPIKNMKLIHHADPVSASPQRAWSDSIGTREGGTESVGFAVLEKITNPDYPGDWAEYPDLPWFQPTFPAQGTRYVLKKGTPLVLRYRLWIRKAKETSEAQYAEQWRLYNNTSKERTQ